jgi:serine kinase of HPr protein (carbohydrate metabolism regulator)
MAAATVHASAVLVGDRAVLIRGPSGAGKSRLALELIQVPHTGALPFARLVGDDRVHLQEAGGRLLVRPASALAGLLEVRGAGILRLPYEPNAVIGLVVDLAVDGQRWPEPAQRQVEIHRVRLPRLGVAAGEAALPTVLALLTSSPQLSNTHMNVPPMGPKSLL